MSKRKIFDFHKVDFNILLVIFSSLILRIFLSNFGTLQLDHGTFVAWANNLAENGFKTFYSGWSDYLPGFLYILYILGKINLIFPALQTLIFKLPAIIADLATGYLIYKITLNRKNKKVALTLASFYLFNPAIIYNSTLWGQVDSLTALFSLFSVYIFPVSSFLSAVTLSIGTLIKPQAAFIFPAIIYLFFNNKKKPMDFITYCIVGLLVFVLGFVPFNNTNNLFQFVFDRLKISSSQYPYGSVNAFSFWGIFGFWRQDLNTWYLGIIASLILTGLSFVKLLKHKNSEYKIMAVSLLATFLFLTRMHERHLLPVLAPLLLSSIDFLPALVAYFGYSFTYITNLVYAYVWITKDFKEIFNPVVVKFLIVLNLILFVIFAISLYSKKASKKISKLFRFKFKLKAEKKLFFTKDISIKKAKNVLFLILAFSLIFRVYGLGNPKNEYFDEVYHVFTAKLMLHGDPKAWEWWNPHPEGFAYEWTHPPLAKTGMVLGMEVFGENAFGSRVVQALLGVFSSYLLYLIVLNLFKDRKMALYSALALALEGLFLVMNRIGMNDTYMVFFMLLSYLFFVKEKNFWSALAFGLSVSSKWSAIYFIPVLGITHFVLKRKITISYLWYFIIPPLVYVGSYLGMFLTGHTWKQFIEVQRQMWWYHTNLKAEHPYTSPAWTWPFLIRPIYLYNGPEENGLVERIYAFGNPAVFWFGLFSVITSIIISWKEKVKKLGLIVFSYLVFFLPWIASPRIMFLYHYLPSIPFLCILIGFVLRKYPGMVKPFLFFSFLLFIYFYPHWTAIKIPEALDKSYYWFPSWR